MNTKTETIRKTSTARELVAQRQAEANARANARIAAAEEAKKPVAEATPASVPAVRASAAVTVSDSRPYRDRYLDEVAPTSMVGRMIKFSKDGKFITIDDNQEVPEAAEYIALCDETIIGWVKFNGVGERPIASWAGSMTALSCRRLKACPTGTRAPGKMALMESLPTRGSTISISCCRTPRRRSFLLL